MAEYMDETIVSMAHRQELIKSFPCFESLTDSQCAAMAALMRVVKYIPQENVVIENEIIDSIFIIVQGDAEVTRTVQHKKKMQKNLVAALHAREGIGLNDTGFYSTTGKRTATVTAVTELILLKLELQDLYAFLQQNKLESSMYAASLNMLRMRFIKQSLPFARLSYERLQWLAEHVEEVTVPAGTIIFNQGDQGDKCYLVRSGQIEIVVKEENGTEKQLAILKPPVLFGEATMITHSPRNATAKALEESDLFTLNHACLTELLESEKNAAKMFMTLMVDRSRPLQNPNVTIHQRISADGQEMVILKNPDNGTYFKLSQEGAFVWQQLDGKHTLQEVTMNLANDFNVFAPDVVAALISRLNKSGFIRNLAIHDEGTLVSKPLWVRAMTSVRQILETRIAFGDSDKWVTRMYQNYIRYLFTKPAQIILACLVILGFVAFVVTTGDVLLFFSFKHASLLLILTLIPLSLAEVFLHELGHAFAVKACGREVHYIGVGWYWVMPIAFTDTSDMWLASRKSRIFVNLAGVYVDVLVAGLSSLLMVVISNPYIQGTIWLFALYTYINAFRMLSPLQEMDGYYVLMDWLEINNLRKSAVIWLVNKFPQAIRHPALFKQNWPAIVYWLACIIYIILVSLLTLTIQAFVFSIIGIQSANPYISLALPFLVVVMSCLSIFADIKNQAEE